MINEEKFQPRMRCSATLVSKMGQSLTTDGDFRIVSIRLGTVKHWAI